MVYLPWCWRAFLKHLRPKIWYLLRMKDRVKKLSQDFRLGICTLCVRYRMFNIYCNFFIMDNRNFQFWPDSIIDLKKHKLLHKIRQSSYWFLPIIAPKIRKSPEKSTISNDYKIPGSIHLNPEIFGLEYVTESRDFGIGMIPGFNTKVHLLPLSILIETRLAVGNKAILLVLWSHLSKIVYDRIFDRE